MNRRRRPKTDEAKPAYPYTWTRGQKPTGRKGQPCRVLRRRGRGCPGGVVLVAFPDGQEFFVAENGLQPR